MIKYVVEKGDTLDSIAEKQLGDKSKAKRIADLNNGVDLPPMGTILTLPASYYKVQDKDSLDTIARLQLGNIARKKEIISINHLQEPLELKTGTILQLPVPDLSCFKKDCYIEVYEVKEGETIASVAKAKLGSEERLKEIIEINGMKDSTVQPKQLLKLPIDVFRSTIKDLLGKIFAKPSSSFSKDIDAITIFVNLLLSEEWIEGSYSYMYPDPKALVTVGLGHNVNKVEVAVDLPFCLCHHLRDNKGNCNRENHIKAKKEGIQKAHAFVSEEGRRDLKEFGAVKSNKRAYYNSEMNNLILEKDMIIELAKKTLQKDYKKVKENVSNDPLPAVVGFLDVVYNAGPHAFPKFYDAVRKNDWIKAALESQVLEKKGQGGITKRNILKYELFMKAALMENK